MKFDIPAMTCGHCAGTVTQTIQLLDPEAKVSVDLAAKQVTVQTQQNRDTLAAALAQAGYPTN